MIISKDNHKGPKDTFYLEVASDLIKTYSETEKPEDLIKNILIKILRKSNTITDYDFEFSVIGLLDKENRVIRQIETALKDEDNQETKEQNYQFENIQIPLDAETNYIIRTLKEQKIYLTHSFMDILRPTFSEEECFVLQESSGIKTSLVFPLKAKKEIIGIVGFATKNNLDNLSDEHKRFLKTLIGFLGIVIENNRLINIIDEQRLKLENAYIQLEQLDKTKDDFLSVASHELRTPMTIIKSYLWMLMSGKYGQLNDKQHYYMDIAMKSTERMIEQVNEMLNISRIEQGLMDFNIESLDIVNEISNIIQKMQPIAQEAGLSLDVEPPENIQNLYVLADKSKLYEIMNNLLNNAIKFTETGGITITIDMVNNDYIRINICDTGVGIDKENIKALFRKFGRLDNSFTKVAESGGTGLGLHIVKLYIDKMGGKVGVESDGNGKGSTFWFTLHRDNITKEVKTNLIKETVNTIRDHV